MRRIIRVKICGITRKEDLLVAVEAGADAIGFIVGVHSSPRNLTHEKAAKLIEQVPIFVDTVVVTTPQSIQELAKISEGLKPSAIQIHGKKQFDAPRIREEVGDIRLIRTIHVNSDTLTKEKMENLKRFDAILLDSFAEGQSGGTGKIHDWALSKEIKEAMVPTPVILAGGLNPENVKEAVLTVKPYAVDVASGVELKQGVKDHKKVRLFVENVKQIKLEEGT